MCTNNCDKIITRHKIMQTSKYAEIYTTGKHKSSDSQHETDNAPAPDTSRTHGLTPDQRLSLLVRMKDDFDGTPRTWHCPAGLPAAVAARSELLRRAFPRWRNVTGNDGNVPRLRRNQRHRSSTATTSSVFTHARVNDGPFSTS